MKLYAIIPSILTAAGLMACSSASKDDATASSSASSNTRTATGTVQATSVDELNLTGALAITLPAVLTETSSSLRLTGSKSIEACLMRESMGQLVTQIQAVSSTLCHIEAEGKNIPWKTPALLDFSSMGAALTPQIDPNAAPPSGAPGDDPGSEAPAGPGVLGIYADDSNPDSVAVYICQGASADAMTLAQAFKIEGSKTITKNGESVKVSKGNITLSMGDDTVGTFKGAIGFDSNYTKSDTSALKMQIKFGAEGFSFAQSTGIETTDAGISKVTNSQLGSMSFGGNSIEFKNASAGLFDAENAQVFYTYSGGGASDFSTQACVDADSYLVDCTTAKFLADGDLYLTTADVPGVLPSTFSPASPSGFDCATADWSTKISLSTDTATLAKHQACDQGLADQGSASPMGGCFSDADYIQSSASANIEFSEETPGDIAPTIP